MKNNYLKLVMMAAVMLSASIGFAQTTTGNITKQDGIINGTTDTGGTVKVIDNKGTIKYLQVANGLTSLTNSTTAVTTTTFQLGGTLTDDTYITADGTNSFVLDGIALATGVASANAVGGEAAQGGAAVGTGWTLLVRDERSGETQKLKLEDLITSAYVSKTVDAAFIATPTITVNGIGNLPAGLEKTWVYRNGVKLRSNVDYSTAGAVITIVPLTSTPPNGDIDWALFADDVITVQVLSF